MIIKGMILDIWYKNKGRTPSEGYSKIHSFFFNFLTCNQFLLGTDPASSKRVKLPNSYLLAAQCLVNTSVIFTNTYRGNFLVERM